MGRRAARVLSPLGVASSKLRRERGASAPPWAAPLRVRGASGGGQADPGAAASAQGRRPIAEVRTPASAPHPLGARAGVRHASALGAASARGAPRARCPARPAPCRRRAPPRAPLRDPGDAARRRGFNAPAGNETGAPSLPRARLPRRRGPIARNRGPRSPRTRRRDRQRVPLICFPLSVPLCCIDRALRPAGLAVLSLRAPGCVKFDSRKSVGLWPVGVSPGRVAPH
jgi:hypothetical protein